YYKGYTTDYKRRLIEHNQGKSSYTSRKIPWKIIYVEEYDNKSDALKREKSLKKCNMNYMRWLIDQPTNILNK
ncbi:MAG: GIY-YIG nuclease family protein, partial [Bacteroidales bacterium]